MSCCLRENYSFFVVVSSCKWLFLSPVQAFYFFRELYPDICLQRLEEDGCLGGTFVYIASHCYGPLHANVNLSLNWLWQVAMFA